MLTFTPTFTMLTASGASDYLDFLHELDAESQYMHYRANERKMTVDGLRSRIRKQERQQNTFVLLALGLEGLPIGYFSVNGGNSLATCHSASVAVGVLQRYQRQGIAKRLFFDAWIAATHCGIIRFECTVVTRNVDAVAFYRGCGFLQAGRLWDRFRLSDGSLVDELVLEFVSK